LPHTAEDYVHRIGRTGRAGHKGNAVSLVCAEEKHWLMEIQKLIKFEIPQEIVPGFEPEAEFSEACARHGRDRHAPAAPASAPRREGRSESKPHRNNSKPSHISADGFDFSRPYIPTVIPAKAPAEQRPASQRPQRPVAVLLGGLGRKQVVMETGDQKPPRP
jgi:ATP-dependent RNA helicase RhlE